MLALVISVFAVSITIAFWWWFKDVKRIEKLMKWVPQVPGNWIFGNALDFSDSTTFLTTIDGYLKRFGKLVFFRIGTQNILVITEYKLLEFVLNSTKILEKSENYRYLHTWLGTGLLTSAGKKWKERRRIITPTFHFQILEQFVDVFQSQGNIFVKKLEKEVGKDSVDIYSYVTLCSLDIICETAMGTSINAQSLKSLDYVASVKEMCRLIVVRGFSPILMYDFLYKLSKEYPKETKALKILHSHTDTVINSRRLELETTKSSVEEAQDDVGVKRRVAFLDMLLQSTTNGRPLTDAEIREEVDTFMFEGHDTVTSAISFAFFLLANHSDVQDKIINEQKEIFGENRDRNLTLRDLQSMKYLECVIKEALRMYPSVPFYARRVDTDIEYNGQLLPKNLTLFIYAYGVNNDPDNFPEPEKFNPSRFENVDGKTPYSYLPFSAGPRNCIGQKFAMLEMKSTLSSVLRHYELLPSIPEHKLILAAETVLKSKNGVKIRVNKRNWI